MKFVTREIVRLEGGGARDYTEKLPVEREIRIIVEGKLSTTATITPNQVFEFLIGHLYAKGVIDCVSQILEIREEGDLRAEYFYTVKVSDHSSGKSSPDKLNEEIQVDYRSILAVLRSALDTHLYRETGGSHSSALCQENEMLCSAEDVGRLNTIDKIIGHALLSDLDIRKCYIVTSGRITKSTVEKAVLAGTQLVASKGAVTSLAAQLANISGITLVGFTRESRMSIYTWPDRVKW